MCVRVYVVQHVAPFATLRRIGEALSKPPSQPTMPQSEDPDLPKSCSLSVADGPSRNWPLYRSPCPHICILSTLIILRTVTQGTWKLQTDGELRNGWQ